MIKKTFRSMFILIFCMVLVCVGLIMGVLYNYFEKQYSTELVNEATYVGQGVELNGKEYLENLNKKNIRITWIDSDGTVLYDNQADASKMENHADRVEVQEAMQKESGSSIRYSSTLSEKTMYYALHLSDDTVVRLANTYRSPISITLGMLQPIVAIIVIALAFSGWMSYRLSKRIVKPINEIDLEHPEDAKTYDELSPFLHRIEQQNRQIHKQIQELKRQQIEFSAITENMSEGFVVVDVKQNILSYNSSALKLLGIPSVKENKNVLQLNRSESFQEALHLALKGEHAQRMMTHNNRSYQLFANPVFQDDVVSGAVLVIMDVTEKEQRDALRREFTANVSHELKTPLTSISGTAEIMTQGLVKAEDIPHFAENIYKEAQRLITLVGDIINLSKLEETDFEQQKELVDLSEIVEEVVATLHDEAQKKKISFLVQTERCQILGIPSILNEIVYNLCDNAIKYNKENGEVTVKLLKKDKRVELSVKDTGIGIPYEEQQRVFERFYRVDKSHSKEIGGTGLGLSIVKHGVMCHNAELKLESEPGKGSCFKVLF